MSYVDFVHQVKGRKCIYSARRDGADSFPPRSRSAFPCRFAFFSSLRALYFSAKPSPSLVLRGEKCLDEVCEDDSLPKIICSQCVDKLESFYDFRESCINAEAMLESYFTSLRYSDDFQREGKQCYVKDDSPSKSRQSALQKVDDKAGRAETHNGKASVNDGLNSLVQAAGIATIIDEAGGRSSSAALQYNRVVAEATGGAGETRVFTYEEVVKDDSAADAQEYEARVVKRAAEAAAQTGETEVSVEIQPATAFAAGQEMLMEFGFIKDRDGFLRGTTTATTDDHNVLARSSIAQIGEFLRMKPVCAELTDGTGGGTSVGSDDDGPVEEVVREVVHQCGRCAKTFATTDDLTEHECGGVQVAVTVVTADSPPPQVVAASAGANNSNSASGTQGGPFPCDTCGKTFRRKEHLFQHRKLHTGERPFSCSVCGKAFSRKEHLVRHAVSHTGEKVHSCELCGKAFSRKDNLLKHRKTHGIAGPYVCEACGKSFVVKHYYLMHRSSHSGNQPYVCDTCGKAFAVKQYLLTHKLRHNRNKGERNQQQSQNQQSAATQITVQVPDTENNVTVVTEAQVVEQAAQQPQVGQVAQAYLCAPTSELIETYRRLHSA
ncbi:hypothetical protein B566_EDAN008283 [Ephemera danica]|nr:hypothetical protein B566_EDAN008283 [Ephemera danica]